MRRGILVVDDDEDQRRVLAQLLKRYGFEVITAADGEEALELVKSDEPDLVLLDVNMPGLDGFEVCRRIKANPETRLTPVILVTALTATEDRVRGIEAGADDFLSKPVDRNELLARTRSLLNLKAYVDELERAEAVLFSLARSIEARDPYTGEHCERLSEQSVRLGRKIGLSEEQLTALRRGGVLHDIGKVAVPDAILLKPGPLTPEEFDIMKVHTIVGERICSPLKTLQLVLPIIRHHHEKLDGSGYPDGLSGEEIPLTARLLQIVDIYDALTTRRPYNHGALSRQEALTIMERGVKKGWWDSGLYHEFLGMMTEDQRT
jgi:putative two-component system response regulator